jgi:predicted metalloendopeptidase
MSTVNTVVNHVISYSGDGMYGHTTCTYLLTQDEADNLIGFMTKARKFVRLNWAEIKWRLPSECKITRMINVNQHSYDGRRTMETVPNAIEFLG